MKVDRDIPIMGYVHELENKVREARAEAANYRKLAFMVCIKSLQFWGGVAVGLVTAGVPIVSWMIYRIVRSHYGS